MKRSEAKAFVNSLLAMRTGADDDLALSATAVYPAWAAGVAYLVNDRVLYGGVLYKVLQNHLSQADWTPPTSPGLFAKVLIPDASVIPEWEQPDSTNGYMTGDKVTHNGKTWISTVDNNVWEPGAAGTEGLWSEVTE